MTENKKLIKALAALPALFYVAPAFASGHLDALAVFGEILLVVYALAFVTYILTISCFFINSKLLSGFCWGFNILNLISLCFFVSIKMEAAFYVPQIVIFFFFLVLLLVRYIYNPADYDDFRQKRNNAGFIMLGLQALAVIGGYFWMR